jgi:MFS transporter, DHA2 family, multidrug resistance protein
MAIVQNALPILSTELGIGSSESVWIVTLYMLVTLTLLLPFAALSDRIGYTRFYVGGFAVFIGASLLCGLAGSFAALLLGRLLQGCGAAAMMCSTTSLIRLVYPRAMMARAIGANSSVVAVSLAAAPSLSSFILVHLSWHWLFLINVPLGLVAVALGAHALPPNPVQLPAPASRDALRGWVAALGALDWIGVVLNIAFFTLLLFGTDALGRTPVTGAVLLAATVVIGVLFVRRQIGAEAPMLPFDLLRERNYAFTIATSFASFAAQGAAFVSLPFYLQRTLGYSPAATGLILTAWPLALGTAAQGASRLAHRVPISRLCAAGLAVLGGALIAIAARLGSGSAIALFALLVAAGAGFGLFQTPNNYVIIASAPADRSGAVGGLRAATRTGGQLIGAALAGLMFLVSAALGGPDGATLGLCLAAAMALWASFCSLNRRTPDELAAAKR